MFRRRTPNRRCINQWRSVQHTAFNLHTIFPVKMEMERYCTLFSTDVSTWKHHIESLKELPFQCGKTLGRGKSCPVYSVHSIVQVKEEDEVKSESESEDDSAVFTWLKQYYECDDFMEVSGSESSSSSSSFESSNSGSDDWTNLELSSEPLTSPSPMGIVALAVKSFSNLNYDYYYQAISPGTKKLVKLGDRKLLSFLSAYGEPVIIQKITERLNAVNVCYPEFISESLLYLLLTQLTHTICPHIVMGLRAFACNNTGYILQEQINGTLEDVLECNPNLTVQELAGFCIQICFTLHMLQSICAFKHHDLHYGNIFLKKIDDELHWKGKLLKEAKFFSYIVDANTTLTIRNSGYIVKIGDFATSSLYLHGKRLQSIEVEVNNDSNSWGPWNNKFEGYEGYDLQMLFSSPPFDMDSWRAKDEQTQLLLQHLRSVSIGPNGKLTERCRPVRDHVSRVPPLEVLKQVFVAAPKPWYDFTQRADCSEVLCLGSVFDLHTPPRQRRQRRK